MSQEAEQSPALSPIKRALRAVEDMQARLDAVEYAQREPIAIIGMGCRFPGGANTPEKFWHLLQNGIDAIKPVPGDRWNIDSYYDPDPDAPGKMYNREGGFLDQVDAFDPQFFGISAREAISLDPQQRLLLEVSWEALENANQSSERLFNTQTGVLIGICSNEYKKVMWDVGGAEQIDPFCATGNALSVAAGRLSHALGLKGPNLAIDTACSSSLVAVHLACQQLRQRDCHMALAGGVNLLLSPETNIAFARTRVLDPDSRCKTFDATSNGYVRGEGCGVVVLKRLSDAVQAGDKILAVIRGSAVNHNGRSSSLVAPNGLAQQAVIRQALNNGKVDPVQVSYVEVQGTGTALGQPIEVGALEAVYGKERSPQSPLMLGSVKTNIGHTEGASGIASLIKVILSLQQGEIPPHLHFSQPNPHINWDHLPFKVPTERTPWTATTQPRIAGISSFGFSGTNAHVVVEEAPPVEPTSNLIERPLHLLTLSAKTETALSKLAEQYEKYISANPDAPIADICFTANVGRSHFSERLAIVAHSSSELYDQLAAFNARQSVPGVLQGKATSPPKVAFVFAGKPAPIGISRQLYETQPTFRQAIDRCNELLQPELGRSLIEILYSSSDQAADHETAAVFTVEYALFQLWKAWGIEPTAVIGQDRGEYVAAYAAGVLSLEDTLKLVTTQSQSSLKQVAATVTHSQPRVAMISSLTGKSISEVTSDHWCRLAEQTSQFADGLKTLTQQEYKLFVEIGLTPIEPDMKREGTWLASCHEGQDNWQTLLHSLSTLYVNGVKVNWSGFDRDYSRSFLHLPTYPWQRSRYWFEGNGKEPTSLNSQSATVGSAIANPFQQIDPQQLTQQLTTSGELSPEEIKLLPKLLNILVKRSLSQTAVNEDQPEVAMPQINQTAFTAADIQAWMVNKIAKELGVKPNDIDVRAPFDSYGLDSVLAISIASAGKQFLGIEVSPLMLVHYPSIAALSQHLAAELEASESEMFEI
jgi:acyl transferase domain-containing protein